MAKKSDIPQCVENLALRFNVEARDVLDVVTARSNTKLVNRRGEDVWFSFYDTLGGVFKVACGHDRADYIFTQGHLFEPFGKPFHRMHTMRRG